MKPEKSHKHISFLAPLLLFVIFTTCILSVLLTGADTYKRLSQRDQDSFQRRTVAQYLTTRIRQSDAGCMVFVGDFSDDPETSENMTPFPLQNPSVSTDRSDVGSLCCQGDTLILREEIDGQIYDTRIYCHDGYLRELFSPAGLDFSLSAGDEILEVNSLYFTLEDDILSIRITYTDTSTETLLLYLRSGEEVSS